MSSSLQPGFDGLTIPPGEWPQGYTYRITRYADVILRDSFPGHWDDLISALDAFRIDPATDVYQAGGNRSSVAVRFDGALHARGWGKRNITISMSIPTIGQRIQAARKRAVWGQAELASPRRGYIRQYAVAN